MSAVENESLSIAIESRGRGAGRPRSFDRDKAVAQALALFRHHGYEGVSIADLTGAIGIAPPSLYAAFGSKAGLFEEALALYVRETGARTSARLEAAKTLEQWVRALLDAALDTALDGGTACLVSSGMVHCGPEHDNVAALVRCRRTELYDMVQLGLGRWCPEDKVERLARFLCALLQGISVQAGDGATRDELSALVEFAVAAL